MKISQKDLDFYDGIDRRDRSNPEVAEFLDLAQKKINFAYNVAIKKKVKTLIDKLPFIFLRKDYLDQLGFSANKVSNRFNAPTEIGGISGTKVCKAGLVPQTYHVYHDQVVGEFKFDATSSGSSNTHLEVNDTGLKGLIEAHSHNSFVVFSSPDDNQRLELRSKNSPLELPFKVGSLDLNLRYAIGITFNHQTSFENRPHVEVGVTFPLLEGDGLRYDGFFHSPYKNLIYKKTKDVKFTELQRLEDEINSRVRLG